MKIEREKKMGERWREIEGNQDKEREGEREQVREPETMREIKKEYVWVLCLFLWMCVRLCV